MTQAANLAALGTNAGTTGILPIAGGGTAGTNGAIGFKNRIINGAMTFDQRNNGASVTNVAGAVYSIDRWSAYGSQASKYTIQQNAGSVTPPVGFSNYVGITSSSAYTIGASEQFRITQFIEGYNTADLNFGSANAKTVTLSFWVRSSLTGTFGGSLNNSDYSRSYPFSYTISVANTWEQKTITVAGDTSGTWQTTNSTGVAVVIGLGVGSSLSGTAGSWSSSAYVSATGATSVVGTSGATFYITGCQLEVGSAATNFDFRSYGTELQLCQRYFEMSYSQGSSITSFGNGFKGTSTNGTVFAEGPGWSFSVSKRANPTVVLYNAVSGASSRAYQVSTAASITVATRNVGTTGIGIIDYTSSGGQNSYYIHYTADAEL